MDELYSDNMFNTFEQAFSVDGFRSVSPVAETCGCSLFPLHGGLLQCSQTTREVHLVRLRRIIIPQFPLSSSLPLPHYPSLEAYSSQTEKAKH